MTIGCAMLDDKNEVCWLGTDTLLIHDYHLSNGGPKRVRHNGITVLVAGPSFLNSIIKTALEKVFPTEADVKSANELTAAIRTECEIRKWVGFNEEGKPEGRSVELLLTDGIKVFAVDSYLYAHECREEFSAIGAGSAYAHGAAHAAKQMEAGAARTVRLAVTAAIENNLYCGGEPWVWKKKPSSRCRFE